MTDHQPPQPQPPTVTNHDDHEMPKKRPTSGPRATGLARMTAANQEKARRKEALAMQVWSLTRNFHTVAATPFEGGRLFATATSAMRAIRRASERLGEQEYEELRAASLGTQMDLIQRQMRVYNDAAAVVPPNWPVMLAATREIRLGDESVRKLLGYDAPRQVEVTGKGGAPLVPDDPQVRVDSLVARLLATREAAIEATATSTSDGEVREA